MWYLSIKANKMPHNALFWLFRFICNFFNTNHSNIIHVGKAGCNLDIQFDSIFNLSLCFSLVKDKIQNVYFDISIPSWPFLLKLSQTRLVFSLREMTHESIHEASLSLSDTLFATFSACDWVNQVVTLTWNVYFGTILVIKKQVTLPDLSKRGQYRHCIGFSTPWRQI